MRSGTWRVRYASAIAELDLPAWLADRADHCITTNLQRIVIATGKRDVTFDFVAAALPSDSSM